MSDNAKELLQRGDRLFTAHDRFLVRWQEQAEQFLPECADFTKSLSDGEIFAEHLFTSDPILMARDFIGYIGFMRSEDRDWFALGLGDVGIGENTAVKSWLEDKTKVMRRAMYSRKANFNRAMDEADRFFAVFGTSVMSVEPNDRLDGLIYQHHHLRDVAIAENADKVVDTVHRKIKMTARQIRQFFGQPGDKIHESILKCLEKENDKDQVFEIRHVMMPSADYDYDYERKKRFPHVSCYVDIQNKFMMREAGTEEFRYVVARWRSTPGSVYGDSPAAMTALPESRMLQTLTRVLQEAGEKAVDPPVTGFMEHIKGDLNLQAGGFTLLDKKDYDKAAHGDIIRQVYETRDPRLGVDILERSKQTLRDCWYLTKLVLPNMAGMTATQVREIVDENIRANAPITNPVEEERFRPTLATTAAILLRTGAFGALEDIPKELSGREIEYTFSSPMRDAMKRASTQQYAQVISILASLREADPQSNADLNVNLDVALRDAVEGTGASPTWLNTEEDVEELTEQREQQQQLQAQAQMIQQGAAVAQQVGDAGQSLGLIQKQAA